jgi:hypothetical protein
MLNALMQHFQCFYITRFRYFRHCNFYSILCAEAAIMNCKKTTVSEVDAKIRDTLRNASDRFGGRDGRRHDSVNKSVKHQSETSRGKKSHYKIYASSEDDSV